MVVVVVNGRLTSYVELELTSVASVIINNMKREIKYAKVNPLVVCHLLKARGIVIWSATIVFPGDALTIPITLL